MHEGLSRSLGHRRNLLSRHFTHIGVGLVQASNGWYVTQIFTRPATGNSMTRKKSKPIIVALSNANQSR